MRSPGLPTVALALAVAAAALTACGSGTVTTAPPAGGPTATTRPPVPGPPTATSAAPPPSPSPPTSRTTAPTAPRDGCLSGTLQVLHPGADNPLRSACVRPGAEIVVTLTARASYQWAPVATSAPAVVAVVHSHTGPDRTTTTTLRALLPGTADLTSADTFTPDPHGPPSDGWQLSVYVSLLRGRTETGR
ncbi:hypothetical protein [Streptomyces sp. NPDC050485]|uniref:hypothetical protein n=1 Tax=Streptomyces sp. NPDC050485 TaxID=3365617 RepID=UPI0037A3F1C6